MGLIYFATSYFSQPEDMLKVYGDIFYDDYNGGDIVIFWRKDLKRGKPVDRNNPYIVNGLPAKYKIYVPRSVGSFYVSARCIPPNSTTKKYSTAYFVSDLITIGPKNDGVHIDVHLTTRKMLMDSYAGAKVKISGRIIYENYKKGQIGIAVESPENHKKVYLPPDIARKFYRLPGVYSIEIPINAGEVYVKALNYPDHKEIAGDTPGVIYSSYEYNPIKVESSNIENIDITLK